MLLSDLQHCKQIEFNICFIQIINNTSIILVQTTTSPIITDYDKNNLISKLARNVKEKHTFIKFSRLEGESNLIVIHLFNFHKFRYLLCINLNLSNLLDN